MKNLRIIILFLIINLGCNQVIYKDSEESNYKSIVKRLTNQGNWKESNEIAKIQLTQIKNNENN
jgi:hypothetical protein